MSGAVAARWKWLCDTGQAPKPQQLLLLINWFMCLQSRWLFALHPFVSSTSDNDLFPAKRSSLFASIMIDPFDHTGHIYKSCLVRSTVHRITHSEGSVFNIFCYYQITVLSINDWWIFASPPDVNTEFQHHLLFALFPVTMPAPLWRGPFKGIQI